MEPQFFDIFGVLAFIYILVISLLGLLGRHIPKRGYIVLALIGFVGLLIDGYVVYTFYLK